MQKTQQQTDGLVLNTLQYMVVSVNYGKEEPHRLFLKVTGM